MNLISFANFTQSDNQNSFVPSGEKDGGNGEDFSSLLNNISVTLQIAAAPVNTFQNNLQAQTLAETGQNLAVTNNPNLAVNSFVQTANPEFKTNLNQTFFSTDINSESFNQATFQNAETPNLQTESIISSLQVTNSVQIPTNFQPVPNLPTMQNLWSGNSVSVNLPPIPKPQIPLPDNKSLDNFSNQDSAISNNSISFNTTIPENAKEFEIVKEVDFFVANQKLPLVSELQPEAKIAEENIFPQTSNLPNISLSFAENNVNEKPIKIDVESTKVPEIQPTVEKSQRIETSFDSFKNKIDFSPNFNQQLNISDSNPKVENSNFIPNFNAVLEYPVSQKIEPPQVNLPQVENSVSSKKNSPLNFAANQEVEFPITQNSEPTQNPVDFQTVEIKPQTFSENPTVQTNFPALNLTFENKTEPTFESSSTKTNISIPQTNFENKVEVISENPTVQRNIPVSQTNVEINPELKAEPVLRDVSSFTQPQQNPLPKVEMPTENKISEIETPVIKLETNSVENKEIKSDVKPDLKFENEVVVEAQKPKIEDSELKSELKPAQKEPTLETKNLPVSNESQSLEFVSNKVEPEVKSYAVKPLNVVSQNIEEMSVNQPTQNIPNEEIANVETANNDFVKFSLPTEENVIPQASVKTFALNTENTEPVLLNTENIETAKTPQIIPDKILTTDFAAKAELAENKTVTPKAENSEVYFSSNAKTQVQSHELPTNQKQNQTQDTLTNESVKTETNVKISETNSSNSSPYFNLSEKSEQDKKFNDPQNDLTVNFDKIFDNIIKKKEGVEAAPKTQTEPTKIAEQVTPELLQMAGLVEKKNGKEILKLRLNPAELGTVEITLEKNSSGVLNAHFKTETESARQALSNGLEQLRDTLQNNGWNIGQMDISNGSSSSANHQPQQNNQQKSEWIENFSFDRSSEKPDDSENNSPARLLNLQA